MAKPEFIQSFDGRRLAVWDEGLRGGPAILLSHYLGGSAAGWDRVAAALVPHFRVVRYDTRGHGRSDAPPAPYTIDMLGRDALSVTEALELGAVRFAGVSQGGMAGMWLAANHPAAVASLVLANTTAFIPVKAAFDENIALARAEGLSAIAARTIAGWVCDAFKQRDPDQLDRLIETMAGMAVEGYAGACAVLRDVDLRPDLPRILAPTLVVAGEEDGPRGAAAAAAIVSAIPNARAVTLPGAAHLSHIENPEAFGRLLLEHFQ